MNFNFNPQMFQQASSMFANMSDDQIKQYASMAGLGNIDPSILRNQANMMNNMGGQPQQQQPAKPPQQKPEPPKKVEEQNYQKINDLKLKGNDAFKKQNYTEAASKYLEAIMEIEEIQMKNKYIKDNQAQFKELKALEIQCRSNYCNVKSKQNDFETVRLQALKILEIEENEKAYFRLAQAQYQRKEYELALKSLEKSRAIKSTDQIVNEFYEEVKKIVNKDQNQTQTQDKKQSKKQKQKQMDKEKELEFEKQRVAEIEKQRQEEKQQQQMKLQEEEKKETELMRKQEEEEERERQRIAKIEREIEIERQLQKEKELQEKQKQVQKNQREENDQQKQLEQELEQLREKEDQYKKCIQQNQDQLEKNQEEILNLKEHSEQLVMKIQFFEDKLKKAEILKEIELKQQKEELIEQMQQKENEHNKIKNEIEKQKLFSQEKFQNEIQKLREEENKRNKTYEENISQLIQNMDPQILRRVIKNHTSINLSLEDSRSIQKSMKPQFIKFLNQCSPEQLQELQDQEVKLYIDIFQGLKLQQFTRTNSFIGTFTKSKFNGITYRISEKRSQVIKKGLTQLHNKLQVINIQIKKNSDEDLQKLVRWGQRILIAIEGIYKTSQFFRKYQLIIFGIIIAYLLFLK